MTIGKTINCHIAQRAAISIVNFHLRISIKFVAVQREHEPRVRHNEMRYKKQVLDRPVWLPVILRRVEKPLKGPHVVGRAGLAAEIRRTLVPVARDRLPGVAFPRRQFRAPARANKRAKHPSVKERNNFGPAVRVARLHRLELGCARARVTLANTYGRSARSKVPFGRSKSHS